MAVREGLAALTTAEVAREAGLSKGLVFFHYGSKDALLLALFERLVGWLLDVPAASGDLPPAVRLLGQLAGDAGYREENRERIDLLLQCVVLAVRRPELHARAVDGLLRYREVLRGPAEDLLGEAAAPDPAAGAEGIAALTASVVIGSALQSFVDPRFSQQTVVEGLRTLVDLPRPPAAGR